MAQLCEWRTRVRCGHNGSLTCDIELCLLPLSADSASSSESSWVFVWSKHCATAFLLPQGMLVLCMELQTCTLLLAIIRTR